MLQAKSDGRILQGCRAWEKLRSISEEGLERGILVLSASQEGHYLILDTGATDHVFPRRDQFHSYDSNVPLSCSFVRTADNRPHQVIGIGIVVIQVTCGDRKFYFGLRSLHVPSLGQTCRNIRIAMPYAC